MDANTSRPGLRWARRLASLAIATAGLATAGAGAIASATPAAAASGFQQANQENPDGGPDFTVVEYAGFGNYDYVYDDGLVRQYRNFTFVGQFSLFGDGDSPR
jgi:hypothetical protein